MSYPGSKAQAGVFQRIIGQMPPHSTYVEPFFGSGQIFWRKRSIRDRQVTQGLALCPCGCGRLLTGKQQSASVACRKRIERSRRGRRREQLSF